MKRTLMTLALGLALSALGCGGAVEQDKEGPTGTGTYGLEGEDPGGADQAGDEQTTEGVVPDDDPSVEGPTPDPWKAPVSAEGYGTPGPCPDESGSAQKTSSCGN